MEKILVTGNRNVRIDKCKSNHGIWFDSGELEDILGMRKLDKNNKVLVLLKDMLGNK